MRHLTVVADLAWMATVLANHAGHWAVFKGPVLSEAVYSQPDLRSYADIDLLVRPRVFERVLGDLRAGGADLLDVNWALIRTTQRAELSLRLPAGNHLDLHWHVINHAEDRLDFRIETDQLLDRTRTVEIAPLAVPTFDDIDTLLHLALHASMDGGHRLVWYLDIAEATRHVTDWEELVSRARRHRISLPAGVMLRRTSALLQLDVAPSDVVPALLDNSPWAYLTAAADRLRPPMLSFDPPAPSLRMLTASIRGDTRSSARHLLRRALREVVDPAHPWRTSTAPEPANPLRDRIGDDVDRAHYLRYVREAARA